VDGVVIRDVTAEGRDAPSAFEGVAPARWRILKDGEAWLLS
jgi:hypothetical protein